ncbi:hypothetical protein RhoFasSB10_03042 [Rhodococcus fascians]|uniref:hypothetical protein n=1 Tax=Rhodococcoides fascians TaxID=1828 RepID=UPI001427C214|nr:hypothetical protein [Rhodococcus fascians]
MLLAQVEQFVYNAPSPWWTVGTGLGAAVLAGVFATVGWYVVHKTSNARELTKWRRDTLTNATVEFFQLSRVFDTMIINVLHPVYPNMDYDMELSKIYDNFDPLIFTMQITKSVETAKHALAIESYYADQIDAVTKLMERPIAERTKRRLDKFHDNFMANNPGTEKLLGFLKEDLKNNL